MVVFFLVSAAYLFSIFDAIPFLQHEMVGQAHWWIQSKDSMLHLLFDSQRMDCHPGRFRYLEYLVQAGYWKLTALGVLPRNFYDYFSIAATLLSAFLVKRLCELRKLSSWQTLLLVALFLGSTQVYLVALFNFRKAKVLTSLFLLILVYASERMIASKVSERKPYLLCVLWASFGVIGCFTDPFFVLLAPLAALALDLNYRSTKWRCFVSVCLSTLCGAILVLCINNLIGVHYSPNARISLTGIPGRPVPFLNPQNIFNFYKLLPDILLPDFFDAYVSPLGLGMTLLLAGLLVLLFKRRIRPYGFCVALGLALPIGAFCIDPIRRNEYFTGYYGHPFLLFFIFALIEGFRLTRDFEVRKYSVALSAIVLVILGFHLAARPTTLDRWTLMYSGSPSLKEKVIQDYALILEIEDYLLSDAKKPYILQLDHWKVRSLSPSMGQYYDFRGYTDHTDLIYLYMPAIFQKEIRTGRLRIENKKRPAGPTINCRVG